MFKTIIPFTCPHCGANVWMLENTSRISQRGNIVLMQHCKICESTFDIGSITKNGFHVPYGHSFECIESAFDAEVDQVLNNAWGRLVRIDEPMKQVGMV